LEEELIDGWNARLTKEKSGLQISERGLGPRPGATVG